MALINLIDTEKGAPQAEKTREFFSELIKKVEGTDYAVAKESKEKFSLQLFQQLIRNVDNHIVGMSYDVISDVVNIHAERSTALTGTMRDFHSLFNDSFKRSYEVSSRKINQIAKTYIAALCHYFVYTSTLNQLAVMNTAMYRIIKTDGDGSQLSSEHTPRIMAVDKFLNEVKKYFFTNDIDISKSYWLSTIIMQYAEHFYNYNSESTARKVVAPAFFYVIAKKLLGNKYKKESGVTYLATYLMRLTNDFILKSSNAIFNRDVYNQSYEFFNFFNEESFYHQNDDLKDMYKIRCDSQVKTQRAGHIFNSLETNQGNLVITSDFMFTLLNQRTSQDLKHRGIIGDLPFGNVYKDGDALYVYCVLDSKDKAKLNFKKVKLGTYLNSVNGKRVPSKFAEKIISTIDLFNCSFTYDVYPNDINWSPIYFSLNSGGLSSCMTHDTDVIQHRGVQLSGVSAYSTAFFGMFDNNLALVIAKDLKGRPVGRGIYCTTTNRFIRWYGNPVAVSALYNVGCTSTSDVDTHFTRADMYKVKLADIVVPRDIKGPNPSHANYGLYRHIVPYVDFPHSGSDPFLGAGGVAVMCKKLGLSYIDLSQSLTMNRLTGVDGIDLSKLENTEVMFNKVCLQYTRGFSSVFEKDLSLVKADGTYDYPEYSPKFYDRMSEEDLFLTVDDLLDKREAIIAINTAQEAPKVLEAQPAATGRSAFTFILDEVEEYAEACLA